MWREFKETEKSESRFLDRFRSRLGSNDADARLSSLHKAFTRLESLEVPLILIPDHIGAPKPELAKDASDPLVLLFERIGRNGASLSSEDLLFSMIKQQWPQAQNLVNEIHAKASVRAFMGATDYVMTAFRLAAAQCNIGDNPRPNPNDFHRNLDTLLGKAGEENRPLRDYLKEKKLEQAFEWLFSTLSYRKDIAEDIGLPSLFMPHLSRGLMQVLLRWVMLNYDLQTVKANRQKIISFSLFWYMNVWHEDKASKDAFEIVKNAKQGLFPAKDLYAKLIEAPPDKFGLALPLMSGEELEKILNKELFSASFRSKSELFNLENSATSVATVKQHELFKRFCWWRKPVLLWLQRTYVHQQFNEQSLVQFVGLTDEDTVPYDYDHLCPQNHWGADIRKIKISDTDKLTAKFSANRDSVGNCIGNLHVIESSLNRSFGDDALALKLKSALESQKWRHQDSLLYHFDGHKELWETASPGFDEKGGRIWCEASLQAFQSAVHRRAQGLYDQYHKACAHILS